MVEYTKGHVGSSSMCERIANEYPDELRSLWRKTEDTGNEWGQVFFETQSGIMYTKQSEGDSDEMDSEVFEDLFDRTPDHAENITVVHTHPSHGIELSMNDLTAFVKSAMVTEYPAKDGFVQGMMVLTSVEPMTGRDELSLYGMVLDNETTANDADRVRKEVLELLHTRKERVNNNEYRGFADLRAQAIELVNSIAHECGITLEYRN